MMTRYRTSPLTPIEAPARNINTIRSTERLGSLTMQLLASTGVQKSLIYMSRASEVTTRDHTVPLGGRLHAIRANRNDSDAWNIKANLITASSRTTYDKSYVIGFENYLQYTLQPDDAVEAAIHDIRRAVIAYPLVDPELHTAPNSSHMQPRGVINATNGAIARLIHAHNQAALKPDELWLDGWVGLCQGI